MKSPLDDVHIPTDCGLAHVLLEQMEKFGSRPALIDASTGRRLTYAELRQVVLQLAGLLCQRGFQKGQSVLLACQNTVDFPVVFLALSYLGVTFSALSPQARAGELKRLMLICKPDYVMVTDAEVRNRIQLVIKECVDLSVKEIFVIGPGQYPDYLNMEQLLKDEGTFPRCNHQHNIDVKHQVAAVLFSSGTSGLPKGVMLSHYNFLANIFQISHPFFRSPLAVSNRPDTVIAPIPFYHVYGLTIVQLQNLFCGNTLVVMPTFSFEKLLQAIEKYKVSFVYIVPPIALQLLKDPAVSRYDLSSVTSLFSGAAPLRQELVKQMKEHLRIWDIRQGYGMTEACPGVLHPPLGHVVLGSVGIPLPNTEVKVVDPNTNKSLDAGQTGELWVRGPQVMIGYSNEPELTKQAVDMDGWLRTGDIGYYDEDGFFYVNDRLKEIIKYKGFQVSPSEIETVLLNYPGVADAAVVGVDDQAAGQLPRAYIVCKPNCKPSVSDIMQYISGELMGYKQLRGGVIFVDRIPRSPSGKILRRLLQEEANLNRSKL